MSCSFAWLVLFVGSSALGLPSMLYPDILKCLQCWFLYVETVGDLSVSIHTQLLRLIPYYLDYFFQTKRNDNIEKDYFLYLFQS